MAADGLHLIFLLSTMKTSDFLYSVCDKEKISFEFHPGSESDLKGLFLGATVE